MMPPPAWPGENSFRRRIKERYRKFPALAGLQARDVVARILTNRLHLINIKDPIQAGSEA